MNRAAWRKQLSRWMPFVLVCASLCACVDDRGGPRVPTNFARSAYEGSTQRFEVPAAYINADAVRLIQPAAFLIRHAFHGNKPQAVDALPQFDTVDIIVEVLPVNQLQPPVAAAPKEGSLADTPADLVCCVAASDVSEYRSVQMRDPFGNRIRFIARGALIEGRHQVGNLKVRYFFSPKITTNYRAIDEFAMNFVQGLKAPGR